MMLNLAPVPRQKFEVITVSRLSATVVTAFETGLTSTPRPMRHAYAPRGAAPLCGEPRWREVAPDAEVTCLECLRWLGGEAVAVRMGNPHAWRDRFQVPAALLMSGGNLLAFDRQNPRRLSRATLVSRQPEIFCNAHFGPP